MPPKITPIRPIDEKLPFGNPEWLLELKHKEQLPLPADGFRAPANVERDDVV